MQKHINAGLGLLEKNNLPHLGNRGIGIMLRTEVAPLVIDKRRTNESDHRDARGKQDLFKR